MGPWLVGRAAELDAIAAALDDVQAAGRMFVVCGDPGIGKSALLEAAGLMAGERGIETIRVAGVPSEGDLPFACLHQLLRPVLGHTVELPDAQRLALETAFGMASGPTPELFLIALAALQLLANASSSSPLAVIVDDAHWLDKPSADVLAFVARRITSDRIVMVVAIREGHDSPLLEGESVQLSMRPLGERDALDLLRTRYHDLAPEVTGKLLREAAGNPLALLELPAALETDARGGSMPLPEPLPLTSRLERAFASKARELPPRTRTLLLVSALDDRGGLGEMLEAATSAASTPVTVADLEPAMSADLVRVEGDVIRFRHPLVRSAVQHGAGLAELQAAHIALANALEGEPDRSVWHRAAAVIGHDPEVAAALELAAQRADMRGGTETAVAALERAADLVEASERRGALLLRAATMAADLGKSATVARLLGQAQSLELGGPERDLAVWLAELLDTGPAGETTRVQRLVATANRAAAHGDPGLSLKLLAAAAFHCYWGNLSGEQPEAVLGVLGRLRLDPGDPRRLQILAYAAPIERGDEVGALLTPNDEHHSGEDLYLLGTAASHAGLFDRATVLLRVSATRLRETGHLGRLAQVLQTLSWSAIFASNLDVAVTASEEAGRLAQETKQPLWETGATIAAAMLAGLRGEADVAAELSAGAERVATRAQAAGLLALIEYVRGLTALGMGQHELAYEHLYRLVKPGDPCRHLLVSAYALGDLVEAAVRTGRSDEGEARLRAMQPLGQRFGSPWFQTALAYAHAQLAVGETADRAYLTALSTDSNAWPFMRARLELSFGEQLRRRRHVAESRPHLRLARDGFDALGIRSWSERARQELRAAGEGSGGRTATAFDELTPQELQIAQMAAAGLSNRDIGERLYLSHRTVESHLYRVFPKLGVTSRSQLVEALAATAPPGV